MEQVFLSLWEHFFDRNCSSEPHRISKQFFIDLGLDSEGVDLEFDIVFTNQNACHHFPPQSNIVINILMDVGLQNRTKTTTGYHKKMYEKHELLQNLYDIIINSCIDLISYDNLDIRNMDLLYDHIDNIILINYNDKILEEFWNYFNIHEIYDELDYYN